MLLRLLLTLAILAATYAAATQEAGHGTVPATGAAAPSRIATTEREPEDAALARIEILRRTLAEMARAYKKAAPASRAAMQPELLAALGRVEAEAMAARAIVAR
jgi:hypothetical protein